VARRLQIIVRGKTKHFLLLPGLLLLLAACSRGEDSGNQGPGFSEQSTPYPQTTLGALLETPTPPVPLVELSFAAEDLAIEPLPLRAGSPFTITAVIHNRGTLAAVDVPVLAYVSAEQEEIGYSPYVQTITVTVPASQSLSVRMPVDWNFSGGEHQFSVQVNRLPEAWQSRTAVLPEADTSDNLALVELMVDPFDAYTSELCPGRVDLEIGPEDVLPEPDGQIVMVQVHNLGNQAAYNVPVVVLGKRLTGIAYTPVIPPCGGTVQVYVAVDEPIRQGDSLAVQLNPQEWTGGLDEDDFGNNQVAVIAGLPTGLVSPPGSGLEDYDFAISTADIETPQPWIVLVTVRNLGTRDAAMVPIRVENQAGRKVTDAIPLVQGDGVGVAAIRVGYLWTRGGTLTFTVNPAEAKGAYPERNRDNNEATFTLP
jgi:hypothetical protein